MNPTVGDYTGNTAKILDWARRADEARSDLVVFPELALSGYPVWDLANKKSFIKEGLARLQEIVRASKRWDPAVVVGFIDAPANGSGRSRNAAAWIHRGKLVAVQHKRLLPTYDVFLEDIFFEPGEKSVVVAYQGARFGILICEDLWDDGYERKPLRELRSRKADFILSISASPYYYGVQERREKLVRDRAVKARVPILYLNQAGSQDDLIFDGRSFFTDAKGRRVFQAPAFQEGLYHFQWQPDAKPPETGHLAAKTDKAREIFEALGLGIRDYCRKNGFQKAVVGLSGGIDSAVVAVLAERALGRENVLGVTMPGKFSSRGSWEDSRELAARLGIEFREVPIGERYEQFVQAVKARKAARGLKPPEAKGITVAMENLQARLRGLELMYISNDEGRLLLTTGNKSELATGYCTLYGDMAGGLCVIGDVYKTDVYRLAKFINREKEIIPGAILAKAPSAELRPDQTDQDSLPPYELLDEVLYLYIEKNLGSEEISKKLAGRKIPRATVQEIIRKVDHNEYKRRQTPPVLRVTEKSWFGRRMPVTNRFQN